MMTDAKPFRPRCTATPRGGLGPFRSPARTVAASVVLAYGLLGCGEAPAALSPPGPLIDVTRWEVTSAAEDPFEDRPASFSCVGGYQVEGAVFEVETDRCAYLTAMQSSLRSVEAGDVVESQLWHQLLVADAPSEAHMAVRLGPYIIAEARPPIPFPPEFYTRRWTAPERIPVGTSVFIHVHNHGSNSYRFGSVELLDR